MSCWGWSPDISVPKISYRAQTKKHQVYDHLPPITKTINFRQTRNAWHCWRSKDELISDVLLWNPSHGRAMAWRLAGTYIKQLCADTGRSHEDQPEAIYDRERWRERVMDIRAEGATWRWLLSVCLMLSISSIFNLLQFSCFFFRMKQFYSFRCFSFPTFHYRHGIFFIILFHSWIVTVYSYCLCLGLEFFFTFVIAWISSLYIRR